jgi:hypothetical protein
MLLIDCLVKVFDFEILRFWYVGIKDGNECGNKTPPTPSKAIGYFSIN